MNHITLQEVRKTAHIAALYLFEQEIITITHDLEAVIAYAAGLADIAGTLGKRITPSVATPYSRPDQIVQSIEPSMLRACTSTENNYFIVPLTVKGSV